MESAVTIVVPCRDAAPTIDAQLAALAEQDFHGAMEVLIVDNRSVDETAARARAWAPKFGSLRVLEATERDGAAYARNVGIGDAAHDIVLACDADDVVDRSWARELVHALQTSDVVGGGIVEWNGRDRPRAVRPRPFGRSGFGFLPGLSGCNVGLRRHAWMELGGFDEQLVGCEDVDFAWRAQLAGLRFATHVRAFCYHRVPERPGALLRKWLLYGAYQPRLYAKFRSHGLRRQPLYRAVARWGVLVVTSYRLLVGNADSRRAWCVEAGRRAGRVVGSLRFRCLYL